MLIGHGDSPGLQLLVDSTAAQEHIVAKETELLAERPHDRHGFGVVVKVRVQEVEVQQGLILNLSKQLKDLPGDLIETHTHTHILKYNQSNQVVILNMCLFIGNMCVALLAKRLSSKSC